MSACKLVVLFAAMTVAVLIGSSDAYSCYKCSSSLNSNCVDPFNSSGIESCTGDGCYNGKVNGVVIRFCGAKAAGYARCVKDTVHQGAKVTTACVCYGDYCNSGRQFYFSSHLALISLFVAFLLFN